MIHLHRLKQDPFSDRIELNLEELVVARKVHRYAKAQKAPGDRSLPFIEENGEIISGEKEIGVYLRKLGAELRQQRMLTGDGCYIDPETGEVC